MEVGSCAVGLEEAVYFLPWVLGGDFTLLESHACGNVRILLLGAFQGKGETHQAFQ